MFPLSRGDVLKNRLVVIGLRGIKTAYMNMPREDAIRAFFDSKTFGPTEHAFFIELLEKGELVKEFEFDDKFGVCDAWEY